jgi:hypothetical protein
LPGAPGSRYGPQQEGKSVLHLPGHRKKLLRDGERAHAVVLQREGANLTQHGFSAYKLVLEVRFPDGSQGELREKVDVGDIGRLRGQVGDVLPVRFDPQDRSAMTVDVLALRAEAEEADRRRDEAAIARGRRRLDLH